MRRFAALGSTLLAAAAIAVVPGVAAAAPAGWGTLQGVVMGEAGCADAGRPFTDVSQANVHCDAVTWLKGAGVTTPAGSVFRPAAPVTRGQMTAFLYRLANPDTTDPDCTATSFRDVPVGHTFCGTVNWARDTGVAGGYPDGSFRPEAPVRRGEMALFLERLHTSVAGAAASLQPCTAEPFTDVVVATAACAAVRWLRDAGITHGYPDGTYRPASGVSRAEMASFLWRMVTETGAFPGLPTVPLSPLAGATVLAGGAAALTPVHRASTRAGGAFTLDVPQGSYRVCADASGLAGLVDRGFADGCLGGVTWDYDLPFAPSQSPRVDVGAGTVQAGLRITLVAAPAAQAGRRGPLVTPAVRDHRYRFITTGPGQVPVTYSSCSSIPFVIRPDGAPPGGEQLIMASVMRLSQVTGLRFVYEGATAEVPTDRARAGYQPARYGERWAPVLIGWSDERENPGLAGSVVGFAGSDVRYGTNLETGARTPTLTSGVVVLDGPDIAELLARSTWDAGAGAADYWANVATAIILHELAHLVGLDHVTDVSQLMYPELSDVLDYAAGDLTGLALAGSGPCVALSDPSTAARALRLPDVAADGIRTVMAVE